MPFNSSLVGKGGDPNSRGAAWTDRRAARARLPSAMATGCVVLPLLPTRFGVPGYIAPLVVLTAGYALFQAANNTAVLTHIRPEQRGVVSGLLNLSRNLGLITGASVMGAVFALGSATTNVLEARPEAVAAGMRLTFAVAAALTVGALVLAFRGHAPARRATPPS